MATCKSAPFAQRAANNPTGRAYGDSEFKLGPDDVIEVFVYKEPELSTTGGTSDGRFLIALCPVVDFGLPNATMHKVDEAASVEDLRGLARFRCKGSRRLL